MTETTTLAPNQEISTSDPGDDVQRRFRYQAAYAALLSLKLLDENSDFKEIYCEQHEDTLVRTKDDTFIGVQVKTRLPGKELFKSNDDEITSAIVRFVALYINYHGHFHRFVLATNHSFWSVEKDNPNNLNYLISIANNSYKFDDGKDKEKKQAKTKQDIDKYVQKIIKICNSKKWKVTINPEIVVEVLKIIEIDDNLPKFDDVDLRLSKLIPTFDITKNDCSYPELLKISGDLITLAFNAASLTNTSSMEIYFAFCKNPNQQREMAIIDGKRITLDAVKKILQKYGEFNVLLKTRQIISIDDLPKGTNLINLKMTRGGISYRNIELTEDNVFSVEYLLNQWLYKFGIEDANKRFDHLKTIISTECAEAFDETYKTNESFGQDMLSSLRKRLRNRFDKEKHLFFECEYEHLIGIAGVLTEMCLVWWSDRFDITRGEV